MLSSFNIFSALTPNDGFKRGYVSCERRIAGSNN